MTLRREICKLLATPINSETCQERALVVHIVKTEGGLSMERRTFLKHAGVLALPFSLRDTLSPRLRLHHRLRKCP